jgi:hypothetical protein
MFCVRDIFIISRFFLMICRFDQMKVDDMMKSEYLKISFLFVVLLSGMFGCTFDTGGNQPSIFEVSVTDTDHPIVDGKPVYVTIFPKDGNIPQDLLESETGTIVGSTATITLDNLGLSFPGGAYKIRAHIDVDNNGVLTSAVDSDYLAIIEVNGTGGIVNVDLNGPWGTYFSVIVNNVSTPPSTDDKNLYLALVKEGDYWGNYTYGENNFMPPLGFRGIDCWACDGTYEFLAFIDTNGNMATTGGPDSGDWVASDIVNVVNGEPNGGVFPTFTWISGTWTTF